MIKKLGGNTWYGSLIRVKPHSSSTVVKNEPLVRIMSTCTVLLSLRRKSPLAVLAGLKGTSHAPLNNSVLANTIAAD